MALNQAQSIYHPHKLDITRHLTTQPSITQSSPEMRKKAKILACQTLAPGRAAIRSRGESQSARLRLAPLYSAGAEDFGFLARDNAIKARRRFITRLQTARCLAWMRGEGKVRRVEFGEGRFLSELEEGFLNGTIWGRAFWNGKVTIGFRFLSTMFILFNIEGTNNRHQKCRSYLYCTGASVGLANSVSDY